MNTLLKHQYTLRRNLFLLVGICLCFYFSYHALQGDRSVIRLTSLNSQIATMSQKFEEKKAQRLAIEKKVVMMRPETLNKDLLEERVRLVLGYKHAQDIAVLSN